MKLVMKSVVGGAVLLFASLAVADRVDPASAAKAMPPPPTCFELSANGKTWSRTPERLCVGSGDKNVEIKLSNHTLTIKGEKSEGKEDKRKDYYLSERRYGSFQRSFQLPEGVEADRIDANFAKGVLTVKLPKTAEAKKAEKTIAVKAA